jgi:hypothetical protein
MKTRTEYAVECKFGKAWSRSKIEPLDFQDAILIKHQFEKCGNKCRIVRITITEKVVRGINYGARNKSVKSC